MRELFPLRRSLTGDGVRQTLAALARELPMEIVETPTGTPVFDWTVPNEWNVRDAWIEDPNGERILDLADSSLHVLGYSTPVDVVLELEELRERVHTHEGDPTLVPYRTSYWEEQWGICMSRRQLESLERGRYRVVIDSTLGPGSLTSGEVRIAGRTDGRVPSAAPTSAIRRSRTTIFPVSSFSGRLREALASQDLAYTYRLLWSPGTLGPLCWLDRNRGTLDRVKHGLTVSCAR